MTAVVVAACMSGGGGDNAQGRLGAPRRTMRACTHTHQCTARVGSIMVKWQYWACCASASSTRFRCTHDMARLSSPKLAVTMVRLLFEGEAVGPGGRQGRGTECKVSSSHCSQCVLWTTGAVCCMCGTASPGRGGVRVRPGQPPQACALSAHLGSTGCLGWLPTPWPEPTAWRPA